MTSAPKPPRSALAQFGETAANYANSRPHSQGESLEVLEAFVSKDGRRFDIGADIATGAGFAAFASAPHATTMLATDPTGPMLEQVRKLRGERGAGNVAMVRVIAEDLPFADGSLDLITCRTAPHHFLDVPRWLGEVARVLKPGGVFVLADTTAPEDAGIAAWMNEIELRRDRSHVRNWTPNEWEAGIEGVGLTVTDTALSKVWHECVDWNKRSHVPDDVAASIEADLRSASDAVRDTFGIEQNADGTVTWFWDVAVVRAEKR